jgi:3-oxoacyl-[acyl-carrier-protein] synthase-3
VPRAVILGVGGYVPDRVVTNQDMTQWMETSNEWIYERTGIRKRHWIDKETGGSELAEKAVHQALGNAGVGLSEVDCIILATLSPDHTFPGTGCFLQERLGIPGVPALDVRTQCSGFIYGLSVADAWIRMGQYKCVLLVGTEVHSTGIDVSTQGRDVACLFGDGAGAVVVAAREGEGAQRGVLSTHLHADGRYAKDLWIEVPGSRFHPVRITKEMIEAGRHWPKMKGRRVFTNAVKHMPAVIWEGLKQNGLTLEDVDLIVPHQANQRINEAVAQLLGIDPERMYHNIDRYGNTTAASIPLALRDAEQEGKLKRSDLVVLVSFGAGFTWASAVVRW